MTNTPSNTSTVNLTINGKPVAVPSGNTIIQAAQQLGVAVPHFCWHPGLSIAGVCRFCMVKVEGMPKLQIACNTAVTEGMKVDTVSDDVKEAHKWALEFHLINHPLDCPICDQAGECELQNYYMKVGKYKSQMEENKVLKPKALDVGETLVLDTERCILCSRCVRFEDEVTKTASLGIFNRGDQAVIGTYDNRRINHNYSYNLVDICPVGAFTAKDFRFKCRVWFLQEAKTICPGCSTGCNVTLFYNKNQRKHYRLKPRFNADINGHWMCDYGRTMYEHLNADKRASTPLLQSSPVQWKEAVSTFAESLKNYKKHNQISKIALVLTPQYTNEEYQTVLSSIHSILGTYPKLFVWRDANENIQNFDGLLYRGDKNPNTAGLAAVLSKLDNVSEHKTLQGDFKELSLLNPDLTIVLGPEVKTAYTRFEEDIKQLLQLPKVVFFSSVHDVQTEKFWLRFPTKTFSEKTGTFVNFKGVAQQLRPSVDVFSQLLGVEEVFSQITNLGG